MSRSDRALIVVVAIAAAVGAAGFLKWRDRRFLEVAESIDPCDEEKVVLSKTGSLGAPALEERAGEGRIVSWRRNGKVLSVVLVPAPSGPARPIAVSVRVEVERRRGAAEDAEGVVLYDDSSGLQRCK